MYRPEPSKTLDVVTKDVEACSAVNLKRVVTIIPARYGSTRFPGKPLALIDGIPMVQQVVERVKESRLAEGTYIVATDDVRIQDALSPFETATVMTRTDRASGSDRIWEAFQAIRQDTPDAYDWIINLQGDEPFIGAFPLRRRCRGAQSECAAQTYGICGAGAGKSAHRAGG